MARRVILDTQYIFTPSTSTIVIPRAIPRERLLLITNVTSNKVLFNFSDPSLTATSYTISQGTNTTNATTTVTLSYNTTSMSATDKIQITVDEPAELFAPDEAYLDPVGKIRVSTPQALIDTDFEYGLQPTKWESIVLLNNRPSFFVNTQVPITVTGIATVAGSPTVNVTTTTPPAIGTPVLIQDTLFAGGNGPFVVDANVAGSYFTYSAKFAANSTGSVFNAGVTAVYSGSFYSNSSFNLVSQPTYSGQVITVNTVEPHGLQVSDGVYITNATASSNPPNGSWAVASIPSNTVFQIVANSTPTGTIASANVYVRPDGYYVHRPFDGGVQFTTGSSAPGIQTIRQTRRYFRYQSGKGIQISTGTILKPNINLDDLSASGTTITVTTKVQHQINPGATIVVSGANESAYNGTFVVSQVLNAFQFVYTANSVPTNSPATGLPVASVSNWYGASNRLGLFDSQNGIFFEYDGQTLYAVRRKSTDQIAGLVNVTNNSAYVTGATVNGVTTKFSKQLAPNDFIVIRGMSYRVMNILSDTAMTISPPYRGQTLSGLNTAIVSKTVDIKVPQSQFNMDKLDGTGPSGLVLDLTKMQMWYMDYSWYGAGSIRFGLRDTQGKICYVHRFINSNQNTEAWMRSGNLPGRYETNTMTLPQTLLAASMTATDASMTVANTSGFPTAGTLLIGDPANSEYVYYTGTTATSFTGLTRGKPNTTVAAVSSFAGSANLSTTSSVAGLQRGMFVYGTGIPIQTYIYDIVTSSPNNFITLTQAATSTTTGTLNFQQMGNYTGNVSHTYSASAPIPVSLFAPQFAPTISHWGTSVIMDGQFDNDKSLVFLYGETATTTIPAGSTYALMSIRVSPSVDSGIPSTLGIKELINRMQLALNQIDVLCSGSFLVTLVLNGTLSGGTPSTFSRIAVGTSSLAQVADHTGAVTISGGEAIYGFYAVNSAGSTNVSAIVQDLTKLRDLGNSILGGGFTNIPSVNVYPDGPDVLTIVAQNIGASSANIQSRLSWTEAQA
jgi:hypothetical protein